MARRPSISTDELCTALLLVSRLDPDDYAGRDADRIKAVIYKVKSMVQTTKTDSTVDVWIPRFEIKG